MPARHRHREVLEYLDNLLKSGKYAPGDILPSDTELARDRQVSVATVRRAYSELVARGWVRRVKKRGTILNDISKIRPNTKIAVIMTNDFLPFLKIMVGITNTLSQHGVPFTCHYHHDSMRRAEELIQDCVRKGSTGLLVILPSPGESDMLLRLHSEGFPIVHMARRSPGLHSVYHDDHKSGFLVGQHFRQIGVHHPAVLYRDNQIGTARLYGFREAMALGGIPLDPARCLALPYHRSQSIDNHEFCRKEVDWLLKLNPPADGVFVFNDTYASAVYHSLLHHAIRIPDQICVAGVDNVAATKLPFPITSVENGLQKIGERAAELIIQLHTQFSNQLVQEVIEPILIPRLSTNRSNILKIAV